MVPQNILTLKNTLSLMLALTLNVVAQAAEMGAGEKDVKTAAVQEPHLGFLLPQEFSQRAGELPFLDLNYEEKLKSAVGLCSDKGSKNIFLFDFLTSQVIQTIPFLNPDSEYGGAFSTCKQWLIVHECAAPAQLRELHLYRSTLLPPLSALLKTHIPERGIIKIIRDYLAIPDHPRYYRYEKSIKNPAYDPKNKRNLATYILTRAVYNTTDNLITCCGYGFEDKEMYYPQPVLQILFNGDTSSGWTLLKGAKTRDWKSAATSVNLMRFIYSLKQTVGERTTYRSHIHNRYNNHYTYDIEGQGLPWGISHDGRFIARYAIHDGTIIVRVTNASDKDQVPLYEVAVGSAPAGTTENSLPLIGIDQNFMVIPMLGTPVAYLLTGGASTVHIVNAESIKTDPPLSVKQLQAIITPLPGPALP